VARSGCDRRAFIELQRPVDAPERLLQGDVECMNPYRQEGLHDVAIPTHRGRNGPKLDNNAQAACIKKAEELALMIALVGRGQNSETP
jgi:hypothetical protein